MKEGDEKDQEDQASEEDEEEEPGIARERQPRRRIPVSKFRFHQLNLRTYPRKGGASHASKDTNRADRIAAAKRSAARSHARSWDERNSSSRREKIIKNESTIDVENVQAHTAGASHTSVPAPAETRKEDSAESEGFSATDAEEPFAADISFPPYPWATEDDGDAVAMQVWRPMLCPFALVDGVIYARKGYEAIAPWQGKQPLVTHCSGFSKTLTGREREDGSDPEEEEEEDEDDVTCSGCGRADRENEMVLCDACNVGWHLDCLSPALSSVPDGDWLCPECSKRNCSDLRNQSKTSWCGSSEGADTQVECCSNENNSRCKADSMVQRDRQMCVDSAVRIVPVRKRQPVVRFKFHRPNQDSRDRPPSIPSHAVAAVPPRMEASSCISSPSAPAYKCSVPLPISKSPPSASTRPSPPASMVSETNSFSMASKSLATSAVGAKASAATPIPASAQKPKSCQVTGSKPVATVAAILHRTKMPVPAPYSKPFNTVTTKPLLTGITSKHSPTAILEKLSPLTMPSKHCLVASNAALSARPSPAATPSRASSVLTPSKPSQAVSSKVSPVATPSKLSPASTAKSSAATLKAPTTFESSRTSVPSKPASSASRSPVSKLILSESAKSPSTSRPVGGSESQIVSKIRAPTKSHRKKIVVDAPPLNRAVNEEFRCSRPPGKDTETSKRSSPASSCRHGNSSVTNGAIGPCGDTSREDRLPVAHRSGNQLELSLEHPASSSLSAKLMPHHHRKLEGNIGGQTELWGKVRSDSLRSLCEDLGAAVSGSRETLISRIKALLESLDGAGAVKAVPISEVLSRVRMSTLRRVCGDLSISTSGAKESLIQNLVSCLAADEQAGSSDPETIAHANISSSSGSSNSIKMKHTGAVDLAHVWQEWPCDGCGRADREDEMVLCDACDAGWHLDCLSPALTAVPEGEWLCPECAVSHRVSSASSKQGQCSDGSRKRVRYAMLRASSARSLDRFELSARSSRSVAAAKRQRVPVSRFRFSGLAAAGAPE